MDKETIKVIEKLKKRREETNKNCAIDSHSATDRTT